MKAHILIIDDEEKLRQLMARIITLEGYDVLQAADAKQAWKLLATHEVEVVLCDVKLPDANGVELSRAIKEKFPVTEIILLTAYGNIPDGVKAIKYGAFDYLTKGDDNDRILPLLAEALAKVKRRKAGMPAPTNGSKAFDQIIGKVPALLQVLEMAKKVATTDAAVLLSGETGVGKEIFAQAIHQASGRRGKNFVAVNCAAISKDLMESEMFGHTAGAFTGAAQARKGLFETAHEGTIFLDEIGEMPLELQVKLLRVLESGELLKLGESKPTRINVRIIAATNRDLDKDIKSGHFRQDLFYRLSTFQLGLPALRERNADIPLLAAHFLQDFAAKAGQPVPTLSDEAMQALQAYQWPGNIRELKNAMERSFILRNGSNIQIGDLPPALQLQAVAQSDYLQATKPFDLATAEKEHIRKVLQYTGGNKTETARLLHIALTTLYRKLDEYQIR